MTIEISRPFWEKLRRRGVEARQGREHLWRPVALPRYGPGAPSVASTCFDENAALGSWYDPVLLSPATVGAVASSPACIREVIGLLQRLEPDEYIRYLLDYYEAGLARFGDRWRYADITTVLWALGTLTRPHSYLEIGVRRGRSMAMVGATSPACRIVGFDMWVEGYGRAANPGPAFVERELRKVGFTGDLQCVDGDSHRTVRQFVTAHPDEYFDLITVDGDHTHRGASLDLRDVLPRLKVGGAIVFDDLVQPRLEHLHQVWKRYVAGQPRFATWEYLDLGYGIGVGIRKY